MNALILTRAEDPEIVEVHGDVPPVEDVQFILALTPGLPADTDWRTREREAAAAQEHMAELFLEKRVQYEPNGDVLWA